MFQAFKYFLSLASFLVFLSPVTAFGEKHISDDDAEEFSNQITWSVDGGKWTNSSGISGTLRLLVSHINRDKWHSGEIEGRLFLQWISNKGLVVHQERILGWGSYFIHKPKFRSSEIVRNKFEFMTTSYAAGGPIKTSQIRRFITVPTNKIGKFSTGYSIVQ